MKILIKMKNPDALSNAVDNAVDRLQLIAEIKRQEFDAVKAREALREKLSKWFKDEEYLTVEIDTEADEATVFQANELDI